MTKEANTLIKKEIENLANIGTLAVRLSGAVSRKGRDDVTLAAICERLEAFQQVLGVDNSDRRYMHADLCGYLRGISEFMEGACSDVLIDAVSKSVMVTLEAYRTIAEPSTTDHRP